MSGYIKRVFPIFLAVTLFVTIIMLCCVRSSDNKIEMQPTVDTVISADTKITTRSHITHTGELRGVWVPYFNLSNGNSSMSEDEFKTHFDEIIKTAKENEINALFVHVRSHCDASYPSDIFPFSDIFTDSNITEPSYDPLEYMVEAAHNAGLEFHAWVNPYRITSDVDEEPMPQTSPCYEWYNSTDDSRKNIIEYDGGLYLNPAMPQVRSLIISGIREIVSNYDIDGVHLDDYFYMFTEEEYDADEYQKYTESLSDEKEPLTLLQWRCANVNLLISGIYAVIKNADSEIQFGISPQGNMENDITMGADVYTWCSERGYIDYIAPQIYYNSDNPILPFEETVDSWKSIITNNTKLYIGLALYKAGGEEDDGTWQESSDIIKSQVEYARTAGSEGFILYSWEYLENEQTAAEISALKSLLKS